MSPSVKGRGASCACSEICIYTYFKDWKSHFAKVIVELSGRLYFGRLFFIF